MKKREMTGHILKLMKAYWQSEEKWKARGLLAVVIGLSLGQVYLLVLLNQWNNEFYNTLQAYDYGNFWPLIGEFSLLAFMYIIIAVYGIYLQQLLEIKWRTWMTNFYLQGWMRDKTYYSLQLLGKSEMDNPDQRISDDIRDFTQYSLSLFLGFLRQLVTLGAFSVILWDLSGTLEVPLGEAVISIPGYMLFLTIIYSGVGTFIAHKIGSALIGLNFFQQKFEADFRFNMIRVRENSESIAFYGGEGVELEGFSERFKRVVDNFYQLMKRTKLLNFYINGYGQLAIIAPMLMVAPKYFAGEMQLGGLMQTVSAFGRVQDALSYFVDAYGAISQYVAVIKRLSSFSEHMEAVKSQAYGLMVEHDFEGLRVREANINIPEGRTLVENLSLSLRAGDYLLISGPSGCGKSTLLRFLAHIWPYGQGEISYGKESKILFLPQRPYLPLGNLRRAIFYPQGANEREMVDLRELLTLVGLEALQDRLEDEEDWSRILSLGEQQRLAFLRILLFKPKIVFLDESTSAMDAIREKEAYSLLKKYLPELIVVSVAHRSSLLECHNRLLTLAGDGSWSLRDKETESVKNE